MSIPEILTNKSLVELYSRPTSYYLGDEILYNLCAKYPKHKKDDEIIAKVWLIGRAYAAALERNKKKQKTTNDDFYENDILPIFKNFNLDDKLDELKPISKLDMDNLSKPVEIHGFLTEKIRTITGQNNRSFSSKYLHFHFPDLFYIYDSRAVSALSKFKISLKDFIIKNENVDKEYAQFSYKCFHLQKMIFENTAILLSIRELDNLLLRV